MTITYALICIGCAVILYAGVKWVDRDIDALADHTPDNLDFDEVRK